MKKDIPHLHEPVLVLNPEDNIMYNIQPLFDMIDIQPLDDWIEHLDDLARLYTVEMNPEAFGEYSQQLINSAFNVRDMFVKLKECQIKVPRK